MLLEENDNGSITDYIYVNGKPMALFQPTGGAGTLDFIHDDHLGTPQFVTNSSQAVVWSTTYQPCGKTAIPVGSVTQNLRLPGQYFDSETGFYQNGARDYVPSLGRYLETDPIGLGGGLNTYLYAWGNPLLNSDPYGLVSLNLLPTYPHWQSDPSPEDIAHTQHCHDAEDNFNPPDVFSIAAHGLTYGIHDGTGDPGAGFGYGPVLDAPAIEKLISTKQYKPGQTILFLSCNTGKGAFPVAQQLANDLGVVVIAPDDYLEITWSDSTGLPTGNRVINGGHFYQFSWNSQLLQLGRSY